MIFNKIVKKMGKKCGKILFKNDIFELIDPEKKDKNINKLNKLIYRLKIEGVIINLKSGVYIVPDLEDRELNIVDLIDKYYWKLLKKYITYYVGSSYYISGLKSLELHNKNYSTSERIFVVNRKINKRLKIGSYEIVFKTISGNENGKKLNLYSKFSNFISLKEIENIKFKISNIELALLETALLSNPEDGLDISLLNKTIKKYGKVFNIDNFYEIGQYKYIMSFNRLKELSKNINKDLYNIFLDIIKKNGGLFIGEGLRQI